MKLNCPSCKEVLNQHYNCKNQHQHFMDEGVLQLMTPQFKNKLETWLIDFESFRKPKLKKIDFNGLPKSGIKLDKNTWEARLEDISIINKLINPNTKKALDVGSWNSWLSNCLANKGIEATAIDYFVNELDGLKARKFYDNPQWTSIQMDLEDLSVFNEKFDLIVLNRCFPYYTDIEKLLHSLINLLSDNGQLIITGLNIAEQQGDTEELKEAKNNFKEKYHKDFLFKPFKGFVDENDISSLKSKGFEIILYPNLKNRVKKLLSVHRNITYYAVYNK
jgi:2-polyprenyl-3-methyl-5-hydroxy-6-metoxy-1,4-benzoquinol methylase